MEALMGAEMLARLQARYTALQARLSEQEPLQERREELRARMEGLNPDHWSSVEEAVRGIERFESEVTAVEDLLGRDHSERPE